MNTLHDDLVPIKQNSFNDEELAFFQHRNAGAGAWRKLLYEDAKRSFIQALKISNNFGPLYTIEKVFILEKLAYIYYNKEEYEQAIATYLSILEIHPNWITHWNLGEVYFDIGTYPKAAEQFEAARKLNHRIPQYVLGVLGCTYFSLEQFESALKIFTELKETYPHQIRLKNWCSKCFEALEMWEEAVNIIVEEYPIHKDTDTDQQKSLLRIGKMQSHYDIEAALCTFQRFSQSIESKKEMAMLYRKQKKFNEAKKLLISVLDENPGDRISRLMLSTIYLEDNQFEEGLKKVAEGPDDKEMKAFTSALADRLMEQMKEIDISSMNSIYQIQYYLFKNDFQNALIVAREHTKANQQDAEGFGLLGLVYKHLEQYRSSKIAFEKAITLDGGRFEYLLHFAELLYLEQNIKEAKIYFQKVHELNATNSDAIFGLGLCNYETGNNEESFEYFKRLIELEPERPVGYYYFSLLLEKLGKTEESNAAWKIYQKLLNKEDKK